MEVMPDANNAKAIELNQAIDALAAYRQRLKQQGHPAKAAVVDHCIAIVKRLAVLSRTTKSEE
jgi:hypothetical protein